LSTDPATALIARWSTASPSERANSQLFLNHMKESINKPRIHYMEVGRISDGFFHTIGQISKCAACPIYGNGDNGTDAGLCHDHVDVLRFQPSEHGLLVLSFSRQIKSQAALACFIFDN